MKKDYLVKMPITGMTLGSIVSLNPKEVESSGLLGIKLEEFTGKREEASEDPVSVEASHTPTGGADGSDKAPSEPAKGDSEPAKGEKVAEPEKVVPGKATPAAAPKK